MWVKEAPEIIYVLIIKSCKTFFNFVSNDEIRSEFCTCYDSSAAMTCEKHFIVMISSWATDHVLSSVHVTPAVRPVLVCWHLQTFTTSVPSHPTRGTTIRTIPTTSAIWCLRMRTMRRRPLSEPHWVFIHSIKDELPCKQRTCKDRN